jgi:hypothetical protein
MLRETPFYCPECDEGFVMPAVRSRRGFLQAMGGAAAIAAVGGRTLRAADAPAKPAEALIKELYATLDASQKKEVALPYDHDLNDGVTMRQRTFNASPNGTKIGEKYTKPQQELNLRILKSILKNDEAYERLTRHGKWDSSGSFENCGAVIFGEPGENSKFAWVFGGHHLTLRCDGNSAPGAAWGGPIYYGHSVNGYDKNNVYLYQTDAVQTVYDALDEKQRAKAHATNNPGDTYPDGIKPTSPRHGIPYKELTAEQKATVEKSMRVLLDPFRKEDADEVMQLVKANGGMDEVNIAFYKDDGASDKVRWHFWRLEGPGFVWNFRPLPHVHCFVNIMQA